MDGSWDIPWWFSLILILATPVGMMVLGAVLVFVGFLYEKWKWRPRKECRETA